MVVNQHAYISHVHVTHRSRTYITHMQQLQWYNVFSTIFSCTTLLHAQAALAQELLQGRQQDHTLQQQLDDIQHLTRQHEVCGIVLALVVVHEQVGHTHETRCTRQYTHPLFTCCHHPLTHTPTHSSPIHQPTHTAS